MFRILIILFILIGCEEFNLPKQKAYLAHQFSMPNYQIISDKCDYSFMINSASKISFDSSCNAKISYDFLKADIFISNFEIKNNLDLIRNNYDKKILDNSNLVSNINISEFNNSNNIHASSYSFVGNAPSNIQFYVTDSISNFLTGSLYFNTKPNYDSLLPSISYVKNDIKKIVETINWN